MRQQVYFRQHFRRGNAHCLAGDAWFGATTCGSVLLLGSLASATHRARMQGWLASATSLSFAAATFACGRPTGLFGAKAYLAMAALAGAGSGAAVLAGWLRRRLPA